MDNTASSSLVQPSLIDDILGNAGIGVAKERQNQETTGYGRPFVIENNSIQFNEFITSGNKSEPTNFKNGKVEVNVENNNGEEDVKIK